MHLTQLLRTPKRANTQLDELVRFFQETSGLSWERQLEQFVRRFSGAHLRVPPPPELAEVHRDMQLVRSLQINNSADNRLAILRQSGLDYDYLVNIWRVATSTHLEPPPVDGGREAVMDEARSWCEKYQSQRENICKMYRLSTQEKQKVFKRIDTQPPAKAKKTKPRTSRRVKVRGNRASQKRKDGR